MTILTQNDILTQTSFEKLPINWMIKRKILRYFIENDEALTCSRCSISLINRNITLPAEGKSFYRVPYNTLQYNPLIRRDVYRNPRYCFKCYAHMRFNVDFHDEISKIVANLAEAIS